MFMMDEKSVFSVRGAKVKIGFHIECVSIGCVRCDASDDVLV